jgi:hypothetical protein
MCKASEPGVPLILPPGSEALHIRDTRQNALSFGLTGAPKPSGRGAREL